MVKKKLRAVEQVIQDMSEVKNLTVHGRYEKGLMRFQFTMKCGSALCNNSTPSRLMHQNLH